MSKRDRKTVVNNIQELNLEIDYDKLKKTILDAQKEGEKNKSFRSELMRIFNCMVYAVVLLFSLAFAVITWVQYYQGKINLLFDSIALTVAFVVVGFWMAACLWEALKDDGEAAMSYFNTNISLVALIVALVALFKGVR